MAEAVLLVVGGMHPTSFTAEIVASIAREKALSDRVRLVVAPQHSLGVLSAFSLRQVVTTAQGSTETTNALIIWAFSAGCVGAAALATHWQQHRGPVLALCLLDGWGVPRPPTVPVYRLSHDRLTHDSSRWLGAGDVDFYADPAVPHLSLWRQPEAVTGWSVGGSTPSEHLTAADFLCWRSQVALAAHQMPLNNAP